MNARQKLSYFALGLILLGTCGCGGGSSPAVVAEPEQAKTALTTVLDAWKKGEPYDAPTKLSPPIKVADEDWLTGVKLVEYRIETGDVMVGSSLRCPVLLTLTDKTGKTKKRQAVYNVNTNPVLSVVRQD